MSIEDPAPLADRVHLARGPDLAIDAALALALDVVRRDHHGHLYRLTAGTPVYAMNDEAALAGARYTADLNDLATILAQRFKNWNWRVGRDPMGGFIAEMARTVGHHWFCTHHRTPALALAQCVAEVLDARLERMAL